MNFYGFCLFCSSSSQILVSSSRCCCSTLTDCSCARVSTEYGRHCRMVRTACTYI